MSSDPNALCAFIDEVVASEWKRQYGDEELKSIKNPLDYTEYVSNWLLDNKVAVIFKENGLVISESALEETQVLTRDDLLLRRQFDNFMPKLMKYDLYIDARDFALAIGYEDSEDATKLILRKIDDQKHIFKLNQLTQISDQDRSVLVSKQGVIDPKKDERKRGEIKNTRSYFHVDALLPLLFTIMRAQVKKSNGETTYDVRPFCEYVNKVLNFTRHITILIAFKLPLYMSTRVVSTLETIKQLMERSHEETVQEMRESTNKVLKALNIQSKKIDTIAENKKNPRFVMVYRKKSWPQTHYKIVGGLASDRRFRAILNDSNNYEIVSKFDDINNSAKIKTDIVKKYKTNSIFKPVVIKDGKDSYNTLHITGAGLDKFIKEISNTSTCYVPDIADDEDEEDEEFNTCASTIITRYMTVLCAKKKDKDGLYEICFNIHDTNGIEPSDDYKAYKFILYNRNNEYIKTLCQTYHIEYNHILETEIDYEWHEARIPSRKILDQIFAQIKSENQ